MRTNPVLRPVPLLAAAAAAFSYARYRRELRSLCTELDRGGKIAATAAGPIEFADEGEGQPLLVIHGAGGGYDQGLYLGRQLFGESFRLIAPSRFGYLRTPVPEDPSPAAQADAHAALLDSLGVATAVAVGVSAGAPSAIELALRHPEKVSALILLVPRTYDPSAVMGVDQSPQSQAVLRLIEHALDLPFWVAMRLARSAVVRFLGVPPALEAAASPQDRAAVTEIMTTILPLSRRVRGIEVDSSTGLSEWPLGRVSTPTLIISAEDDLFKTLPGARFTTEQIKGAELKVLETGGHLMLGRSDEVKGAIASFLQRRAGATPTIAAAGTLEQQQLAA